jgi:hypothetical protein
MGQRFGGFLRGLHEIVVLISPRWQVFECAAPTNASSSSGIPVQSVAQKDGPVGRPGPRDPAILMAASAIN